MPSRSAVAVLILLAGPVAARGESAAPAPLPFPERLLDPMAPGHPGVSLPDSELALRRGWLVFSLIDDARDAVRRRALADASARVARARAAQARSADPDPTLDEGLARAAAALAAGDAVAGDRALQDAGGRLRTNLIATETRLHPITPGRLPTGGNSAVMSYGGSGLAGATSGMGRLPSTWGAPSPGGDASVMSSGPNSTRGVYGYGSMGPGSMGSAIPGYGSYGGRPGGY